MSRALIPTVRPLSRIQARSATPLLRLLPSSEPAAHASLSSTQTRHSSHSPLGTAPAHGRKKVTLNTIQGLYRKNEPITMLTAYDFPSAHVADHAGIDMILVGDSLAMVGLGMDDTSEVTLDELLVFCRAVARGARSSFIVSRLLTSCPFHIPWPLLLANKF